jgi:hypothetical protein
MCDNVPSFSYKIQHSLQILDLTEHTESICLYNLAVNVGHFVSLRHVKIFFIIRRGKRGQEKRAMLT